MSQLDTAELKLPDGKITSFPIIKSTIGESAIDVSALYKQTGMFTFDPGFLSTASCQSKITYIDGDKGILMHRGYKIADLAANSDFISVAYALIYGDLPNDSNKANFERNLVSKMFVAQNIKNLITAFGKTAHPMAIMMGSLSLLASENAEHYDPSDSRTVDEAGIDLIAKTNAIGAYVYRFLNDLPEVKINVNETFIQNLTKMMFDGTKIYKHKEILEDTFDKILILHADHEQNASTSTLRIVASTEANIYASAAAGFAALWGPLHGGANEAVIKMLHEIGSISEIPAYMVRAKDKNDSFRLMGFGHRVYKNYDPRAAVLKGSCDAILDSVHADEETEILKIAKCLEQTALEDKYFIDRKLFPNVDFYSGIIYEALEIPSSYFTVIFGMARSAGWAAQTRESMSEKDRKISRPRQVYIGDVK